MGYSRRTSNYLERITLSNVTHMIKMTNPVSISVETLMINCGCILENESNELSCMSP